MKAVRIIAFALVFAIFSCAFVSCDVLDDTLNTDPNADMSMLDKAKYDILYPFAFIYDFFIGSSGGSGMDVELPETTHYRVKNISFKIADENGKVKYEAVDFEYKSIKEPTVLNIVDYYLTVEEGVKCVIEDDTLVQIGTGNSLKATMSKGEYWAYMSGTDHNIPAIIANESMQNKYFINDQRMSNYIIEEGGSFTVVLIK